ncbi:MAG: AsmA family protein, partial [Gammaproteobacteria bacterium]|nr:AsmA family protein [Gammaproteobacteria bacterium]
MKKLFKWLLVLVAILVISLVVLVNNPGLVKGQLEQYLSDTAGYPISLEGDLDLDLGRQTKISGKNIHVSAPDWASDQNLLAIDQLRLSVDTGSLFEDIIVIESLEVDNLQLNLETDAEGKGNWLSANTTSPPEEDTDSGDKKSKTAVIFSSVEISNSTLGYQNGVTGVANELNVDSLRYHQQADGMMQTTLDGHINDRQVEYTGIMGPYENLLNGKNVSYNATGHLGDLKINSDGIIDDLLEPRRPKFHLDLQGPDIDEITAMLGVDDLGSGGFSL